MSGTVQSKIWNWSKNVITFIPSTVDMTTTAHFVAHGARLSGKTTINHNKILFSHSIWKWLLFVIVNTFIIWCLLNKLTLSDTMYTIVYIVNSHIFLQEFYRCCQFHGSSQILHSWFWNCGVLLRYISDADKTNVQSIPHGNTWFGVAR